MSSNLAGHLLMGVVSGALLLGASGCIGIGGSDRYTPPTLGRQLMDLKNARDTGAISDQEYRHAKENLLYGRVSSAQSCELRPSGSAL